MADSIIRCSEHLKDFTLIDNTCLKTETLSMQAMGLFAYLMSLPNDWEIYKSELVKHFSNGRDAVYKAFNELIDAGFITYTQNTDETGRFTGNTYYIHEKPVCEKDRTKRPVRTKKSDEENTAENCNSVNGKSQPENPYTENPSLPSTNNTKYSKPSINSKSHYEPFLPSEENPSDSESLPKRKRNSKSHCGSATEEKETSEFKQVKDLYLKNYNTLVEQKIITAQKFSQKQWQSFGKTINQNLAKYGLESVLKILTNSFDDDFCRRSGYILTTIFHTNIAPRLLVAPNYYPNSFNKQSSTPRSYQQPRQFDENHLFF